MPERDKYSRIPRYFGLRIYIASTFLFFLLVFPIAGIMLFKYVPEFNERKLLTKSDNTPGEAPAIIPRSQTDTVTDSELRVRPFDQDALVISQEVQDSTGAVSKKELNVNAGETGSEIGGTMSMLARLLLVSFILGFAFNLPFRIYFKKIRQNKEPSPRLRHFVRKFLLKTPQINAGILLLAYGITIIYTFFLIFLQTDLQDLNRQFYVQFILITILASLLTLMLVFFWQKHRVHIRYLEYVFPDNELKKRVFRIKRGKIRSRLWISSAMTTFFPLLIVIFYLALSITWVKEVQEGGFTSEQEKILMGKYLTMDLGITNESLGNYFYVNVVNSLLMVLGIGSGVLVALIYIILMVKWTTEDILRPVSELLASMERAGRGDLESFSIVRTDDEIGELAEGFNQMSEQLSSYITSLSEANQANSRFVPRQFLDFLGKQSITEIQLGDQVQKEMTILFSDIRDFTAISELMTPKQNFDFINNYLGYMEPVIRENNGFIDKFMGDSIMALFPERAEDAINAAIEMRIKLLEFNEVMTQFGKPAINSGIGIHTGMLMLGVIGGEGRMDGTVISDAVNLTSRIEGLTKIYGSSIIITEDTLINISDPSHYHFRFLDIVKVKGKKEAVYVFEIIDGDPEQAKTMKLKTKEEYGRALQFYKKREFDTALRQLEGIHQTNPEDKVIRLYMERCNRYLAQGVPDQWDGVENIDHKF
jgi:class 3 adenylate cyclase